MDTCDICGRAAGGRWQTLHADHDKVTGYVRGYLCDTCNMAIGALGDTVAGLERALAYLRRPQTSILYANILAANKRTAWRKWKAAHPERAKASDRKQGLKRTARRRAAKLNI